MEIYTKSLFGKILAVEDIEVLESSIATTACFYLEERKLVLPLWEGISEELTRFLIAHEVSHALHTPPNEWVAAYKSKPEEDQQYFRHIMNVVEDVRIDRLIMIKYPGIKRDYQKGMIELKDRGFFGNYEADDYEFIDKLNTHLKYNVSGGNSHDFKFSGVELDLVNESIRAETFEDVVIVSQKIFDLFPKPPDYQSPASFDKELSPIPNGMAGSNDANPVDCQCEQEVLDEILEQALEDTFTVEPIRPFNKFIHQTPEIYVDEYSYAPNRENVVRMRTAFNKKKAARRLKERQRKKTGNIDTNRLHQYSISEDVFIRDTIQDKQKNHVCVVLLDGSGSMKGSMVFMAQKVFEIYEFCRLEKIKFMCYMFKSGEGYAPNIWKNKGGYHLKEYFRGRNPISDYNLLLNSANGGTPLCSSLIAMFSVMDHVKTTNPDSKISLTVITDGDCDSSGTTYRRYSHKSYPISVVSERSATGTMDSSAAFYKMMRDIYGCKIISYNLLTNPEASTEILHGKGGTDVHFNISKTSLFDKRSPENMRILNTFIETIA